MVDGAAGDVDATRTGIEAGDFNETGAVGAGASDIPGEDCVDVADAGAEAGGGVLSTGTFLYRT